jgi:hypothetical protein
MAKKRDIYRYGQLSTWLRQQNKAEQLAAYICIFVVLIGIAIGIIAGLTWVPIKDPSVILLKLGGLGIGLPTLIGAFYYLYRTSEINSRKQAFLRDIEQHAGFSQTRVKPTIYQEMIIDMLKTTLTECPEPPKLKTDAKSGA